MKKHMPAVLAGLSCMLSLICLFLITDLRDQITGLSNSLDGHASMLQNQVDDSVRSAIEEQASLLINSGYEFGEADMDSLTVPVAVTMTPKEYIPGVTTAKLAVDGREYPMEQSGVSFGATVNLMLVEDSVVESVSFEERGVVRSQPLGWLLSPRSQYLPEVGAYYGGELRCVKQENGLHTYLAHGHITVDAYVMKGAELDIRSITLAEALNGEFTNRTELDAEAGFIITGDEDGYKHYGFELEQEYALPYGSTHELYIEAQDGHGFVHRCLITRYTVSETGSGGPAEDQWQWNGATGSIYSADGRLLYKNYLG